MVFFLLIVFSTTLIGTILFFCFLAVAYKMGDENAEVLEQMMKGLLIFFLMPILLGTIFLISQKIGDVRYAAVKGEDNLYSIKTSSSWQFVWNFYSKDKIVRLLYMVSMLWLMVTFVIVIRGIWINCKIQGMLAERISLIDNCNVKKDLNLLGKR